MCRTSPAFRVGLVPQNSTFGTLGLSGMGGAQCFMPASLQTAPWAERCGLRDFWLPVDVLQCVVYLAPHMNHACKELQGLRPAIARGGELRPARGTGSRPARHRRAVDGTWPEGAGDGLELVDPLEEQV